MSFVSMLVLQASVLLVYLPKGETFMKRFNRKKLIPSLAASLMVAAATLAPLPGFLAAGGVAHADPAHPLGFAKIESPAKLISYNQANVDVEYRCSPVQGSTAGSLTVTLTEIVNGNVGMGVGTIGSSFIMCDNKLHETSIVVMDTGNFVWGKAFATAVLKNATGTTVANPQQLIHIGQ
jgi:hypothetical protein